MRPQDEWDGGAGAEPQPYVPPPHHWRDAEDQNIIVRVLRLAVPWVALIAVGDRCADVLERVPSRDRDRRVTGCRDHWHGRTGHHIGRARL